MKYFLHGKLTATQGEGKQLTEILVKASKLIKTAKGCRLYTIGKNNANENEVWVTEIWDSKADHDNSLNLAGVKDLIGKAFPILDGMPTKGQELEIIGGHGI